MHIRENEATDSIDWDYFHERVGQNWQHPTWNLLHDTVANIPCSVCREEAVSLMKALHDLVNARVHPDRPLFDQSNFLEIAKLYQDAASHYTGPHLVHEIEV